MTSKQTLYRAFAIEDVEIRTDVEGRTVCGVCVPYDQTAEIRESGWSYSETMRPGVFARSIEQRGKKVPLLSVHDGRRMPLGRASMFEEKTPGLYGEFFVSRTAAGDEALELARDGALSFSVGFKPIRDSWSKDNRKVDRLEAALIEVSLVPLPAYEGAVVTGVRGAESPVFHVARERAWLDLQRLR